MYPYMVQKNNNPIYLYLIDIFQIDYIYIYLN
jgi:hypothetical protein